MGINARQYGEILAEQGGQVPVLPYLALKIFWPGGHDSDFDGSNVLTALLDLAALARVSAGRPPGPG
jgi:hypothetical protein